MTYIEYLLITSKEYDCNMPPFIFSAKQLQENMIWLHYEYNAIWCPYLIIPNSLTREEGFVEPLFEQPYEKLPPVLPKFPTTEYPLFACLFISLIGHILVVSSVPSQLQSQLRFAKSLTIVDHHVKLFVTHDVERFLSITTLKSNSATVTPNF